MKVTSATLGPRSGARLLWITVLVSLALGITLTLVLTRGSAAADGPNDFLAPIVLEEGRTPPKVVDPPGVHVTRDVPGQGGAGVRQTTPPPATRPVNDNTVNCNAGNAFPSEGTYVHTGYYRNTGDPICEYRPRTPGWGEEVCSSRTPTWRDAGYGLDDIDFTGRYTSSGQPICSNEDGLHSSHRYTQEQQLKQLCIREPTNAACSD